MACTMRYLGVVGLLTAGGCTGLNPWFQIETEEETGATDSAGTLGETTTTATPTTAATDDSGRTTSDATSDEPTTAGASSEPGTISATTSSTDPSASDSLPMTATGETGGALCGDHNVDRDLGEECDEGPANGVEGDCTADCLLTVCGDGYEGTSEECDLGPNNSNDGVCTPACTLTFCGDGTTNGAEVCDDGPANGKVLGKCSADCTTNIPMQTLKIKLSEETTIGKFSGDNMTGIFAGDFLCGEGFEVMAASPGNRIASTGAFDGKGQDGWVLEKYRGYTDGEGVLVGITGVEGLLGVVNGQPVNLMAPIGTGKVWTGLKPTWQTAEETCKGWVSPQNIDMGVVGEASSLTGSFLGAVKQACNLPAKLYCVEQLP